MPKIFMLLLVASMGAGPLYSQPSPGLLERGLSLYDANVNRVTNRLAALNERTIRMVAKLEARLSKRLAARKKKKVVLPDTMQLAMFASDSDTSFLIKDLTLAYVSKFDSVRTALAFLESYGLVDQASINALKQKFIAGQNMLDKSRVLGETFKSRLQGLTEQLKDAGMFRDLRRYKQMVGAYRHQAREYISMLQQPEKAIDRVLRLVKQSPLFRDFFRKYSALAAIMPPDPSTNLASFAAAGSLQTRSALATSITQQLGTAQGANQLLQQQLSAVNAQLQQLKDKLSSLGGDKELGDLPDFKPNTQRAKSLLDRLQIGTNVQHSKSAQYFPTTSDIAVSLGYKLSDRATIGVGSAVKVGWGKDIKNVKVTGEGVSIRSFVDVKSKRAWYLSGGFELDYQQPFVDMRLPGFPAWTRSGLIGVGRVISMKSKFFKQTTMQASWNFLADRHAPQYRPFVFRMGYRFSK